MPTSYLLSPNPIWYFDDNFGNIAAGAQLFSYRQANQSQKKPVFQDMGGAMPYPNPLTFDGSGKRGPFYFADDEPYFLQLFDKNGNLIFSIQNYTPPGDSSSNIINSFNTKNQLVDGQFYYFINLPVSPATTIPMGATLFNNAGWYIYKDNANQTDSLMQVPLALGDTQTPPYIPYAFAHYQCTTAAPETKKRIYFEIPFVRTFETLSVTLSFWAYSQNNSSIQPFFEQYFGTGGTPSSTVTTNLTPVAVLTTLRQQFVYSFTVPSANGMTIGSNNDDTVRIGFELPLGITSDVSFTNMQFELGNTATNYDYVTAQEVLSETANTSLRADLANRTATNDGASLIGFYDVAMGQGFTVDKALNQLFQKNFRMLTPNTNFWVWQRGIGFSSATAGTFNFADRWSYTNGNGANFSISRITSPYYFTNFSDYAVAIVATAATTAQSINYNIHNVDSYNGQTITVTWEIANATNVNYALIPIAFQNFGTGGTPSAATVTDSSQITITPGVRTYYATFAIPTTLNKVKGTDGNSLLQLSLYSSSGIAIDIQLSYINISIGSYALPYIARSYGVELADCQAFYETNYPDGIAPGTALTSFQENYQAAILLATYYAGDENGSQQFLRADKLKTRKIKSPIITYYSGSGAVNSLTFQYSGNSPNSLPNPIIEVHTATQNSVSTDGMSAVFTRQGVLFPVTIQSGGSGSAVVGATLFGTACYWVADTGL